MGTPLRVCVATPHGVPGEGAVRQGVLSAVAYADVFGHPLTVEEIHRYLHGPRASQETVRKAVTEMVPGHLSEHAGLFCLRGRESVFPHRRRRARNAELLWPAARKWGRRIAALPFVRMVAVTGSLARDAAEEGEDIDLLVVTEEGRLWVCRALIGLLTRRARRKGVVLCANYLLAESRLALDERDIYTAHELAQMVPLAGTGVYDRMRAVNPWVLDLLPNAAGAPTAEPIEPVGRPPARTAAEAFLRSPAGGCLDRIERRRKRRVALARGEDVTEARFEASCFKGHFDGHGARVLDAFEARVAGLGKGGA